MLNRKTLEAAKVQVNYARFGSLVHDNGKPLEPESLPYLLALRRELHEWGDEVEKEIRRVEVVQHRWIRAVGAFLLCLCATAASAQDSITWTGPKLTPAQAAAILANGPGLSRFVYVPCPDRCDGPYIASTGSKGPTAGPWDFPPERPRRRLDGTLLSDPPEVFGAVPYWVHERRRDERHPIR